MRDGTVQPLPNEIRRLRQERGWTQQDLADKVGCSKRTIENLEAGRPGLARTVADIAQALGGGIGAAQLIVGADGLSIPATGESRSTAPPLPLFLIGRDADLRAVIGRLCRASATGRPPSQVLTAVRGWPGVGKTSLAKAIAHSPAIAAAFPDGVLWSALGPVPHVESELRAWLRVLGPETEFLAETIPALSARLAGCLRDQKRLLIVDDVWDAQHALPLLVGGRACAMLVTTRLPLVTEALAPTPDDHYRLDVLDAERSLELLSALAPKVVAQQTKACRELVVALEGLPLALQVAGRMLHLEAKRGWRVADLLQELRRDAAKLLAAPAPSDMADSNRVSPTVTALLRRSTDCLDPVVRQRYAFLAPFAPRPATFELEDMCAVWDIDAPEGRRTVDVLVDRGLLEPTGRGDFQIHQVLVQHAKSLLPDQADGDAH
jgi:transcriptional regulator with XRE-family HTH domain